MELIQLRRAVSFSSEANTREQAFKQVHGAAAIAQEMVDTFFMMLDEAGFCCSEKFRFHIRLSVYELVVNIAWHDHLSLPDDQRLQYFGTNGSEHPELTEAQTAELQPLIENARGKTSPCTLECDGEKLTLRIELVNPFADFEDRWERAGADPDPESLEDVSGRGLLMARKLGFPEATASDDFKVITYIAPLELEESADDQ